MEFISPSAAIAGVKASAKVTSAVIGRYRPTGIPRLGSKEDRAEAYRRMLDASTRSFNFAYMFSHMKREAGRPARKLLLAQLPQSWDVSAELMSALNGVRLCGTVRVIAAAEDLVTATSDLDINEPNGHRFQQQARTVVSSQSAFLDACREDLGYTARWWQMRRRQQERRFLAERAQLSS